MLESAAAPAAMVRLSEELQTRGSDVAEFFRLYVDAGSDNLVAILSYLDFTRIANAC